MVRRSSPEHVSSQQQSPSSGLLAYEQDCRFVADAYAEVAQEGAWELLVGLEWIGGYPNFVCISQLSQV